MEPNGEVRVNSDMPLSPIGVGQNKEPKAGRVWLYLITGFMAAALAMSILGFVVVKDLLAPAKLGNKEGVIFNVPGGASTGQVAEELLQQGLIKNSQAFKLYARYKGLDSKLKAGEYQISSGMSVAQLVDNLTAGTVTTYSFTIPEGYNIKQIAQLLVSKGYVDEEKFWDRVANGNYNYDFLQGSPHNQQRLEGYLFPAKYEITKGMSEEQIIDKMLNRFSQEITPEFKKKAAGLGISLQQAITLASIVEREAVKDEERPKVAAVFLNRLKKGIKLESCATVQYALGETKSRLLYKDLQINSPYNTYLIKGLPAGPIASPGGPSLQAAVNPAAVDYLFFVVSEDGKHAFSKTLAEHNKNKAKYVARFKTP